MLRWNRNRKGFTLVELAIVIAILGILALYALPKYQGMVEEARSSEAKAQLGSFRSALGIYYAKNHGVYPDFNTVSAKTDNILFANGTVPEVEIAADNKSNNVVAPTGTNAGDGIVESGEVTSDTGGWIYDDGSKLTPAHSNADVRINSNAEDPANKGHYWYEY